MTPDQLQRVERIANDPALYGLDPEEIVAVQAAIRDAKRYAALCRKAEWKPPYYRIDVEAERTMDAAVDSLIEKGE